MLAFIKGPSTNAPKSASRLGSHKKREKTELATRHGTQESTYLFVGVPGRKPIEYSYGKGRARKKGLEEGKDPA